MPVFLFTDIENSTGLWERYSQAMGLALARHDQILQELVGRYGGRILRHRGDGFSVLFEHGDPLACVLAAQKQFADEDWGELGELRVCMVLHAGPAERREFDSEAIGQKEEYFGPVLNRTARILQAGRGGQILVTPEVLSEWPLPPGTTLQDLGRHLLKSLDAPQQIYNLSHPDLPLKSFPPLQTLARIPTPWPPCPYRGLFVFREEDAPYFFGRETFTKRLVEAVHQQQIVAVIGPSGSGKSSVVFAGMLPGLRQAGGWTIVNFRPGSQPFEALAEALLRLEPELIDRQQFADASQLAQALWQSNISLAQISSQIKANASAATEGLLLVIDQFEELYTLCSEPQTRHRFLESLLAFVEPEAAKASRRPGRHLMLTLRADFMAQALIHRPFANALQDATLLLGPMTRQELGRAIEYPAQQQGVNFEPGLVNRLLDDVGDEPGNLPLLEFALTLLWERQVDGYLTHAAYEAIGQVEGALSHYADTVYDEFSLLEQERTRWILVQMVQPGEGTEDTRRLATRTELGDINWNMVRQLADARLVVTNRDPSGQETVEVVHEALIRGWGRLREWMTANRAFRTWQERLRGAMRQWESSGRDEGALLRGALLAEAEGWVKVRPDGLGALEQEFFQASLKLRDQELLAAETRRQRELAQAQALAEAERQRAEVQTRASRRLRLLAAGLAVVFIIAVWTALLAFGQRQEARFQAVTAEAAAIARATAQFEAEKEAKYRATAQAEAETRRGEAERARLEAEQQRRLALSRQLSSESQLYLGDQFDLALLLSLQANQFADTLEARRSLLTGLTQHPYLISYLHGHSDAVFRLAFSPDGQTLASASWDGTIRLWNMSTGQPIGQPITDHDGPVLAMAFSPDGRILASGGQDQTVKLWDMFAGRRLGQPLEHPEKVWSLAFSPDGRLLASGIAGVMPSIRVWEVSTGQLVGRPLAGHTKSILTLAFSPNGQILASSGDDGFIILWDMVTRQSLGEYLILPENTTQEHTIWSVVFSPDGQVLAAGGTDATISLWNVGESALAASESNGEAGPRLLRSLLTDHSSTVFGLAFSPDGRSLASASADNTVRLWDVASGQVLGDSLTGHAGAVYAIAFHPNGHVLASGSQDTSILLWDVLPLLKPEAEQAGDSVMRARRDLAVPVITSDRPLAKVALSPDGQRLALATETHAINLWDVTTGQPGAELTGHQAGVLSLVFSADGRLLASGDESGTIMLWDVAIGRPLGQPLLGHQGEVWSLAFSPDDQLLASGSSDYSIRLWDVITGQPFGRPLNDELYHRVYSLAFDPGGQILASGIQDTTVRVWDVSTQQPLTGPLIGHDSAVTTVVFSPDRQLLASGSEDATVILWDVTTWQPLGNPLIGHDDFVSSVAFSPDGRLLASGSLDGTIILWDVARRQPLGQLSFDGSPVRYVAFTPAGHLISAQGDRSVVQWDIDYVSLQRLACRLINRNLSRSEWQQFIGDVPYAKTCPELSIGQSVIKHSRK